ncbi:hypothetical protein QL285_036926 [Trifolium repens]|nr:hypothetical protein QL285_036926 [Trifolium repens]
MRTCENKSRLADNLKAINTDVVEVNQIHKKSANLDRLGHQQRLKKNPANLNRFEKRSENQISRKTTHTQYPSHTEGAIQTPPHLHSNITPPLSQNHRQSKNKSAAPPTPTPPVANNKPKTTTHHLSTSTDDHTTPNPTPE